MCRWAAVALSAALRYGGAVQAEARGWGYDEIVLLVDVTNRAARSLYGKMVRFDSI